MPVDMNKTMAEASLNNLHDIIVPEAVGFFPMAPGWYILFALFLTLLFHFGYQKYKAYKKDRYRRDALAELETLKEQSKAHTLILLSLAKRVGMAAYDREQTAKLEGEEWWDFMQYHSKVKVGNDLRKAVEEFLYADRDLSKKAYPKLFSVLEIWINTHRVKAEQGEDNV